MKNSKYLNRLLCSVLAASMVFSSNAFMISPTTVYAEEVNETVSENAIEEELTIEEAEDTSSEAVEEESVLQEQSFHSKIGPETSPSGDVADTDLASTVIEDTVLLEIIAEIVMGDASSASTMTVADLKNYEDEVTISVDSNAASVYSFVGLGYLQNASSFDLSACTNVTAIAANEFQEAKMQSIVLPDTIKSIGEYAFYNCELLANISSGSNNDTLPSALQENGVGGNAFNGCKALTKIIIPDNVNAKAIQYAAGLFRNCTSLEEVQIGKNITIIPQDAFHSVGTEEKPLRVVFPEDSQLNRIGENAFAGGSVIIDFTKCKELRSIDKNAFYETIITKADFSACTKLNSFGDSAFNASEILQVVLPEALTTGEDLVWGKEVFANLDQMFYISTSASDDSITIPAYVKVNTTSTGIFKNDDQIASVQIPGEWECIPAETFQNAVGLEELIIADKIDAEDKNADITSIGDDAFYKTALMGADFLKKCTKLESVGARAFANCQDIKDVWFSGTLQSIGVNAFSPIKEGKEEFITQVASVVWENDTKGAKRIIDKAAFSGCTSLESIQLPENNYPEEEFEIGEGAFTSNEALRSISAGSLNNQLPTRTTKIDNLAFLKCISIKEIAIKPADDMEVVELGKGIFAKCQSLEKAEIPANLAEIPQEMFFDTVISSLTMGAEPNVIKSDTLVKIGDFSLFGCQMLEIDLSLCPNLEVIGGWAFAGADTDKQKSRISRDKEEPEFYNSVKAVLLEKLVLPNELETLFINSGAFRDAGNFTSLVTAEDNEQLVEFKIPSYCVGAKDSTGVMGIGEAVFAYTNVLPDDNTIPKEWTGRLPNSTFMGCNRIQNLDFLRDTNICGLGEFCFANCLGIEQINLSNNETIRTIGFQCFSGCYNLISNTETQLLLPQGIESIDNYAFALGAYGKNFRDYGGTVNTCIPHASEQFKYVDLSQYDKLKDIRDGAFRFDINLETVYLPSNDFFNKVSIGCFASDYSLTTIDFGSTTTIEANAFKECESLNLTDTSLDKIELIRNGAFMLAYSLGKVKFGPNLKTIESNAFKQCAVFDGDIKQSDRRISTQSPTLVFDFTNAKALKTIGSNAFEESAVRTVDMTGAESLLELPSKVFYGCTLLKDIKFDKHLQYIGADALAGCPSLAKVTVYSKTMIDPNAFNAKFLNSDDLVTNAGLLSLDVKPYEATIKVALDQTVNFPYYVNYHDKNAAEISPFSYVVAGSNDKPISDADKQDMYLSVSGDVNGYFVNTYENKENLVSDTFFEKTAHYAKWYGNREAYVFQVTGLKKESYPFSVGCSVSFNINGTAKPFSFFTEYTVEVTDALYAPELFEKCTNNVVEDLIVPETEITIRGKVRKNLYYDMIYLLDGLDSSTITDNNIQIISSNPEVAYPIYGSDVSAKETGICMTQATKTDKSAHLFLLSAESYGKTDLTIYPSEHIGEDEYAHTYTVNVVSDLNALTINLPNTTARTASMFPGETAQLEFTVTNAFTSNKKLTSLSELKDYTDREIKFISEDEELVTVDENGVIQILKSEETAKAVKVTAEVENSNGVIRSSFVTITVKPALDTEKTMHANLYSSYNNTDKTYGAAIEPGAQFFQADATNQKPVIFFDLAYEDGEDNSAITNHNVTVVSDNPSVIYAGVSASDKTASASGTTPGVYTTNIREASINPAEWKFTLIPVGVGTATIKVYPGEHKPGTPDAERFAQTYTYTVNADLRAITIEVPADGRTLNPKQTTTLKLKVTNCLNQVATLANMQELAKYTNNKITFTSSDTNLLSVDSEGKVTALKADNVQKSVTIEATAVTSQNKTVTGKATIGVKPLVVKAGETYTDESGLANVKIEKVGTKTAKGEAVYVAPGKTTGTTVTVPSSVKVGGITYTITAIADKAFKNNTTLKTVKMPTNITQIGKEAFSGCKELTTVTLGSNVTKIGDSAFKGCMKLKSITIGKKVVEIGKKAFYGCKNLKKITIKSKVLEKVGSSAFKNINKKATIKAPKSKHSLLKKKGQPKTVKLK